MAMAKRNKRTASRKTKTKASKRKKTVTKKSFKQAVGGKSRRTSKKVAPKKLRKKPSARKRPSPPREQVVPVVEGEIIDVVDEPVPGIIRVTEVEASRVTVPHAEDDEED
jgi:hypothetical protein